MNMNVLSVGSADLYEKKKWKYAVDILIQYTIVCSGFL